MSRQVKGFQCDYFDGVIIKPQNVMDYRVGDHDFIVSMLNELPSHLYRSVTECYSKTYNKHMNDESVPEHQRENIARRNSNIQIRMIVEAHQERLKPAELRKILQEGNGLPYQV